MFVAKQLLNKDGLNKDITSKIKTRRKKEREKESKRKKRKKYKKETEIIFCCGYYGHVYFYHNIQYFRNLYI